MQHILSIKGYLVNGFETISILIGISIILLILAELIASYLIKNNIIQLTPNRRINLTLLDKNYYPPENFNPTWLADYKREAANQLTHTRWQAFFYWLSKPYKGTHININKKGFRKTNQYYKLKPQKRILILGGSTIWGWGARDSYTIPSLLACQYAKHNIDVEVTNAGQLGFVNTQEIIMFMLKFDMDGFDKVIFYDGLNDIVTAFQNNSALVAQNEFMRVTHFNQSKLDIFKVLLKDTSLIRIISEYTNNTDTSTVMLNRNKFQLNSLAKQLCSRLIKNYELIEALAVYYNFEFEFFWQPTIFSKKEKTAYEQILHQSVAQYDDLYHYVYKMISQKLVTKTHYHDISNCLDLTENCYIDPWHVDEKSNLYIADRIIATSMSTMCSQEITLET